MRPHIAVGAAAATLAPEAERLLKTMLPEHVSRAFLTVAIHVASGNLPPAEIAQWLHEVADELATTRFKSLAH